MRLSSCNFHLVGTTSPIYRFGLFNILITVYLAGCVSGQSPAPVVTRDTQINKKVLVHTVASGETLYSIAWRYDKDYKKLAKINGIASNYRIYPGQKIRISGVPKARPWQPSNAKAHYSDEKSHTEVARKSPSGRSIKSSLAPKISSVSTLPKKVEQWVWPAKGKIISHFFSQAGLHKGIDIEGDLGEPVIAAAAGQVVYAGRGLRGYGRLVIVKHSERFLSAYAHNNKILVAEGDKVAKGQRIAEMGKTSSDRVKLYFEIRDRGKPVNPLIFLPKK